MTTDLQRPSWPRRVVALASIVVLHVSFLYLLQHGLLNRVAVAVRETIVFATVFPPAPPAAVPAVPRAAPVAPPMATPRVVTRRIPVKTPPAALDTPAEPPAPARPTSPAAASPPAASPAPVPGPAAPPPTPVTPKTVTSGVQYLQPPQPAYPAQSKHLGEEGRVVLRVLVNESGQAERVEIQQSSGYARLDQAAREAVQAARFQPHLEDGRPVRVFAIVPISFRLDQ